MVRRFGQIATLKPGMTEEYERLHAAVWPAVLKMIKECNLQNYSIYRDGDKLFAYFEYTGADYETDMAKMTADPVTQSWWTHTHPCFVQKIKGVFYTDMKEIFHVD
jgi:L-rhamnose mutarotase